jgi:hypothetical protein
MRLAETALSLARLPRTARIERQAVIVGHAYAAALEDFRTAGTWKLLVQTVADDGPLSPPLLNRDAGGVGVDMVDIPVDPSEYVLAASDADQRRVLLRWLHGGAMDIARAQGWTTEPFENATAMVGADPEYRVVGAWKRRAGRTPARVVMTETLEGVTAAIETTSGMTDQVAVSFDVAWMARRSLSDPRWNDGQWVVIDDSGRVVLKAGT